MFRLYAQLGFLDDQLLGFCFLMQVMLLEIGQNVLASFGTNPKRVGGGERRAPCFSRQQQHLFLFGFDFSMWLQGNKSQFKGTFSLACSLVEGSRICGPRHARAGQCLFFGLFPFPFSSLFSCFKWRIGLPACLLVRPRPLLRRRSDPIMGHVDMSAVELTSTQLPHASGFGGSELPRDMLPIFSFPPRNVCRVSDKPFIQPNIFIPGGQKKKVGSANLWRKTITAINFDSFVLWTPVKCRGVKFERFWIDCVMAMLSTLWWKRGRLAWGGLLPR